MPPDRTATLVPRDAGGPAEPCDLEPAEPWVDDDPGRYEPLGEHARGGLGRVVRAYDTRLQRTVAVKQLLRHDAGHEARFVREALITARLQHPGIVPVHEAGRWPNGEPYYVMKLVEGRTLKELVAAAPTARDRLALVPHVLAVADAVAYAHREGVIHRDLKPANVIVGAFGEIVVVDWGLAVDLRSPADASPPGAIVGTPAYMAPEQARGEPVDERTDVYALGAVLYEVLAGAAPYSDLSGGDVLALVLAGAPAPLARRARGVPRELADIVAKAMARDPAARYPGAAALADDLRRYQTGRLVSAHAYSPWLFARKQLARHPRAAQLAVIAMLAVGTTAIEATRAHTHENLAAAAAVPVVPVAPAAPVQPFVAIEVPPPRIPAVRVPAVHVPAIHARVRAPVVEVCHGKYVTVAGSQRSAELSPVKGS